MNADSNFSIRALWPVVALVLTLAWASGYDQSGPDVVDVPFFDKIAHFFVFGLMGTLWFRYLSGGKRTVSKIVMALVLTLAYGVIDEWIQSMNPHRSSDSLDWVADASGALTAILVYRSWGWYRRILESPVRDLLRFRQG